MNKFLISIIVLFSLSACVKYNDGEGLTTYGTKGRYKNGFWNCYKIVKGNDGSETNIPKFSCILDSYSFLGDVSTTFYFTDGIINDYQHIYYNAIFSSDKENLTLRPDSSYYSYGGLDTMKTLEFTINKLTWKEMILESKNSNKKYYFDKYITNDKRSSIKYEYVEDKTFIFPGFE